MGRAARPAFLLGCLIFPFGGSQIPGTSSLAILHMAFSVPMSKELISVSEGVPAIKYNNGWRFPVGGTALVCEVLVQLA